MRQLDALHESSLGWSQRPTPVLISWKNGPHGKQSLKRTVFSQYKFGTSCWAPNHTGAGRFSKGLLILTTSPFQPQTNQVSRITFRPATSSPRKIMLSCNTRPATRIIPYLISENRKGNRLLGGLC